MAKPTSRVLALLELLQSGGTRTVAELAGRLEVDERTVRRYAAHLVDLDVPVESVRGRYGGYRLMPGFRLPPLMLTDDEALVALLALESAAPAGSETAAAKIRRVLPERLRARLDGALGSIARTGTDPGRPVPDAAVLLPLADAVRHHRPVRIRHRATDRTVHPHGLVEHSGRWYVTGTDPALGETRTFRLDRIERARTLPGTFTPPDTDPAAELVERFATAGYRHEVSLRIQAPPSEIRARLPATVAVLEPLDGGWHRARIRAERLDWIPGVLALLDRPFSIEQPAELRALVRELAVRLTAGSAD